MYRITITTIILITITILQSCERNKKESDLDQTDLKGKVKCISEHYFSTSVDENGVITSNRIKINGKNYIETHYNENGMIEKILTVWEDNIMNANTYTYENNLLVKISHTYNTEIMPHFTTYTYDKHGLVVQQHEKWSDGEYYCQYDSKGELISDGLYEYRYDMNSMLVSDGLYEYKYDDRNNIIEKSSHNYRCISTYDEFDRETEYIIEKEVNDGIVLREHVFVEYDTKGRVFKERHISDSISYLITYDYRECDDRGNWRSKYIYLDDELINTIKRHIEYYEEEEPEPRTDKFGLALQQIKIAYEEGLSHSEILKIPELQDFITSVYSNKYYELMLKNSSDKNILHRNEFGEYFVEYTNAFETSNELYISDNGLLRIFFYIYGIYVNSDGSLRILPWKKDCHTNDFGEKDMNAPYYYIEKEFSGGVRIEIRMDDSGIYFIKRNRDESFHHGAELKIKIDGEMDVLELPAHVLEGILYLSWEDLGILELIELWSYERTKLSIIDTDVANRTNWYTADFDIMAGTKLIATSFNGKWLRLQNNKVVPPHRLEGLW